MLSVWQWLTYLWQSKSCAVSFTFLNQMKMDKTSTMHRPMTDVTQVKMVQVDRASLRVRPKYSLTIQKPAPLTWSPKVEPAPTARVIRTGLIPVPAIRGATKPAPVNAATVVEPRQKWSRAGMSQAAINGEILECMNMAEIWWATPPATRTCLKAPAPPMMRSIIAICLIKDSKVVACF